MTSPGCKRSRVLESTLRPDLFENDVTNWVKSTWINSSNNSSKSKRNDIEIILHPFPVCVVENIIQDAELLKLVREELKDVTFYQKDNDLYRFRQSDDVANLTNFTFIPQLYELILKDGLKWVNKVFGNDELDQNISATFSSYKHRDRLLCHDDKCESRHIAFILYLVDNWNADDGGALELFGSDNNDYPEDIAYSILPKFNTMVLFEVTHKSFHQVSEVLSKTKERLSLNGWFHSSSKKLPKTNCKLLESEKNLATDNEYTLEEYFLSNYFDYMNKSSIKDMFSRDSEIQLEEFLIPSFWEDVKKAVKSSKIKWELKGPANIRKYEVADLSTAPASLQTLKEIFESISWFSYLRSITGLDLTPSKASDMEIWESGILPDCSFELQRWTHTCYTLIHDQDSEFHSKALDVILRLPFERNKSSSTCSENEDVPEKGHIIYIDSDSKDEECLLHIGYKMNSLALIYRDTKTLRFTKYLDSTAEPFYQIFCTYREWRPPVEQPDLRHCEGDSESEVCMSPSDFLFEDDSSGD